MAAHYATVVPIARGAETAGDARRRLVGARFDCATDLAVCEEGRLVGLVSMEKLLGAQEGMAVGELMDPDPPVVLPGMDQERAAWTAVRHGESSLAVVDEEGRFLGLVPARRLLRVLLKEHHEDMARLAGMAKGAITADASLRESTLRSLGHRLPWLLVGLGGALLSADLVSAFESQLTANVVLAFFLPGIVYLADAVGTQTETLVVRGLSLGTPVRRFVGRELVTGFLLGLALAVAAIPYALLRWGATEVVLVLVVSLVMACAIATGSAIVLPYLLVRAGQDPAFGSGPLATVVQDLLSIVIYFAVASVLLG